MSFAGSLVSVWVRMKFNWSNSFLPITRLEKPRCTSDDGTSKPLMTKTSLLNSRALITTTSSVTTTNALAMITLRSTSSRLEIQSYL